MTMLEMKWLAVLLSPVQASYTDYGQHKIEQTDHRQIQSLADGARVCQRKKCQDVCLPKG